MVTRKITTLVIARHVGRVAGTAKHAVRAIKQTSGLLDALMSDDPDDFDDESQPDGLGSLLDAFIGDDDESDDE